MQYLGGKSRIARLLVPVVREFLIGCDLIWEPFCGGLGISRELLPDVISDSDESLIALYTAVRDGWCPPDAVTEDEYQMARRLPESNPLHGFCAFGCSFGGKKWAGYARGGPNRNYARAARNSLLADVEFLRAVHILPERDFMREPVCSGVGIYCDIPYAGTTGYSTRFYHGAFWERARDWTRVGSVVVVSEYSAPSFAECVWEGSRNLEMQGSNRVRTERLFLVRAD